MRLGHGLGDEQRHDIECDHLTMREPTPFEPFPSGGFQANFGDVAPGSFDADWPSETASFLSDAPGTLRLPNNCRSSLEAASAAARKRRSSFRISSFAASAATRSSSASW
jgi:hypothetical protein